VGTLQLSGTPVDGDTLTVTFTGTVAGTAAATSYQWYRCPPDENADCVAIPGAEQATYVVGAADVGNQLGAIMTEDNAAGSDTIESNLTPILQPRPAAATPTPTPAPTSTPTPAPIAPAANPKVRITKAVCTRRRCIVTLALTASARSATVKLRRRTRRVAHATYPLTGTAATLKLKLPRHTRRGRYSLAVTVHWTSGPATTVRKTLRIR
jgi:hypothetical protein